MVGTPIPKVPTAKVIARTSFFAEFFKRVRIVSVSLIDEVRLRLSYCGAGSSSGVAGNLVSGGAERRTSTKARCGA
jgi:hypothetical protein